MNLTLRPYLSKMREETPSGVSFYRSLFFSVILLLFFPRQDILSQLLLPDLVSPKEQVSSAFLGI